MPRQWLSEVCTAGDGFESVSFDKISLTGATDTVADGQCEQFGRDGLPQRKRGNDLHRICGI